MRPEYTDTIKPCPFCGGDAKLAEHRWSGHGEGGIEDFVLCTYCYARSRAFDRDRAPESIQRAISAWNTRHPSTTAHQQKEK